MATRRPLEEAPGDALGLAGRVSRPPEVLGARVYKPHSPDLAIEDVTAHTQTRPI
jgi:hypothetical protein